jgi:Dolichyl-phosphate-mannose-protein mannosyltransferase
MFSTPTPTIAKPPPMSDVSAETPIPPPETPRAKRRWTLAVGALLVGALLLRLWGVGHGLPYAYNADENAHFVPKAIGLFGHGWNPEYFVNPPAYTYLLHLVFAVWFGGRDGVSHAFATHPTEVFIVARVVAAVLGTIAVWLLYLAGSRLIDRRTGLLAAGLLAVGFLPVFYSHLALNDVPTLAPIALCLYGCAGVMRLGRPKDYVVAGIGLGLAAATKYTGGIMILVLVAATAVQFTAPGGRKPARLGLLIAGVVAILAFFIANPYSLLDFDTFRDGLNHQTTTAGAEGGKLGLTYDSGIAYYLWTLTWGLGWVPAIAALIGVGLLWRDERRLVAFLAPAPILFILFMGTQGRFFGRWLMPIFPIVCLLAAYTMLEFADRGGRRWPVLRPSFMALAVVLLCGQAFAHSAHLGLVLSREDTRNLTRAWLVKNVPEKSKIVVEPVVPDLWAQDIGKPSPLTSNGNRWIKFSTSRSFVNNDQTVTPGFGRLVNIEDYERTTRPDLVDQYERDAWCYVVSGSTQSGRAFAEPEEVPLAIAYYQQLEQRSKVVYKASPYDPKRGTVPFNFDWSFDYYPLAYHRPGPLMTIYKLTGGNCADAEQKAAAGNP